MKNFFKKYSVKMIIWSGTVAVFIGFFFIMREINKNNPSVDLTPSTTVNQESIDSAKADSIGERLVIHDDSIDKIEKYGPNSE